MDVAVGELNREPGISNTPKTCVLNDLEIPHVPRLL